MMLKGIRLQFTNEIQSPLFQKVKVSKEEQSGIYEVKTAEVDSSKKITEVSIKVQKEDNYLCAMRLKDSDGNYFVDVEWKE